MARGECSSPMHVRRPPALTILFLLMLVLFVAFELYHHRHGVMARLRNLTNIRPPTTSVTVLEPRQRMPSIQLTTLGGQRIAVAPKPGHFMYLNVFTTWCPDCKKETPALEQLAKESAPMGVDVVGIDQQEEISTMSAFAQAYSLTYPIFMDDEGLTRKLMGVRFIPTSFIVDSHGIVRARITGALTLAQMEQAVGTVLRGGTIATH